MSDILSTESLLVRIIKGTSTRILEMKGYTGVKFLKNDKCDKELVSLNDTILSISLFRSDKMVPDKRVIDQFGLSPIHENGSYLRLDLSMQMEENHTLFIDCLTAVTQFSKKKVPIAITIYTLRGEECKL